MTWYLKIIGISLFLTFWTIGVIDSCEQVHQQKEQDLKDLLENQSTQTYDSDIYSYMSYRDRIKEKDITVLDDLVIIRIKNTQLVKYANTGSMFPGISKEVNGIYAHISNKTELGLFDIISFNRTDYNASITHRIARIGNDSEGIYYITKGDNNLYEDKQKVRKKDINSVLVAAIY